MSLKSREEVHALIDEKFPTSSFAWKEPAGDAFIKQTRRKLKHFIDSIRLQDERDLLEEEIEMIENEIAEWRKGEYHTNIAGGAIAALTKHTTRLRERIELLDNNK